MSEMAQDIAAAALLLCAMCFGFSKCSENGRRAQRFHECMEKAAPSECQP